MLSHDYRPAFIEFLHEKRVNLDLPWEESIRVVIAHPMYKALHTVSERKEAFRKYCADYRKREHEDRHLRKARRREAFLDMLKGEERIGLVSRYV